MLNIEENEANNLVRSSLLSLHWVRMAEINIHDKGNMAGMTHQTFKSEKMNVNESGFLCSSTQESGILAGGYD